MKRKFFLLFVMAVTFLIIPSLWAKDQVPSPPTSSAYDDFGVVKSQEGKKALPFSLKLLNGEKMINLSDFQGKPVLLKS